MITFIYWDTKCSKCSQLFLKHLRNIQLAFSNLYVFSSLLATKSKICINLTDHHQLLMEHTELISKHTYCHTSFHFSLLPWRYRKSVWFAFLTFVKRSFLMIMIFSNESKHEWGLISHACHSHKKKQKDRNGRSPQSHCFHLPHTWRFRGRCNFNWTTKV